jgi:hypothetical protein
LLVGAMSRPLRSVEALDRLFNAAGKSPATRVRSIDKGIA